jgi:Domain of unknown function (DUF4157)/Pretoxin HINT domain
MTERIIARKKLQPAENHFDSRRNRKIKSGFSSGPSQPILSLQRMAGNQIVQRLRDSLVQTKVRIGSSGHVTDSNLSQHAPSVQVKCTDGCHCSKCATPALNNQRSAGLYNGGIRLPQSVGRGFAASFRTSFDDVRLHPASSLPAQFGVDALTIGRDVAFKPGYYQPQTVEGQRLLGHELAHVAQQARGASEPPLVQGQNGANDRYEREADRAAEDALSGRNAQISAAPHRPYGGSAGGCFRAGLGALEIGDLAHAHIQQYFSAVGIYSEVVLPGARYRDSDRPHATGRCDLLATVPPVVPAVPQPYIRPAGYMTSPPAEPPGAAMIGEIKPISYLGNSDAQNQLRDYIDAHDRYYGLSRGSYLPITKPMMFPPPGPLILGDPTFITWPPQALHVIAPGDGVYYYFCRPLGELLPIMEYLRRQIQENLRRLRDLMKANPGLKPQLEPVFVQLEKAAQAAEAARKAQEDFWQKVGIVLLALAAAIAIAYLLAPVLAFIESAAALIESIMALAAALAAIFSFTKETRAEPPPKPSPGPGCFTGNTPVTMADGLRKTIDEVKPGDVVRAWEEATGKLHSRRVLQIHYHPPEPLLRIEFDDGNALEVTHLHTVRSSGRWILSGKVGPGTELLVEQGGVLRLAHVARVEPLSRLEPVYNLTVEQLSTYLAGNVVVHNTGMAKPGGRAPLAPPSPTS